MAFLEVAAIRRRVVGLMAICITTAGGLMKIAAASFVLSWTHSVETIPWQDHWSVTDQGLVLTEARIKGSGAGMEPPEDAVLRNGWDSYHPHIPPRRDIVLAASGKTGGGWTLCAGQTCTDLGKEAEAEPIHIRSCD